MDSATPPFQEKNVPWGANNFAWGEFPSSFLAMALDNIETGSNVSGHAHSRNCN